MLKAKKVPLDLTGGWEDIVNRSAWRQVRDRTEQAEEVRQTVRLERQAMLCGIGGALAGLMAFMGLLSVWVAVPVAAVLFCGACFMAGRLSATKNHN